jgi:ABC-type amino acid transport substrate-binding protein
MHFVSASEAAQTVRVGAAAFPPYIEPANGSKRPLPRLELIELMNAFQHKYRFEVVATGAVRRFYDFDLGAYDISMFDNLAWGWGARPVDASKVYLGGSEVYVARSQPGRGESYFAHLEGMRMIGMRGYHYGFAHFNADAAYLQANYHMVLTDNNEATLQTLLLGRGDVAVVTSAFLHGYLAIHPEVIGELLVSKRRDQTYALSIIVRRGVHPTAAEFDQLLDEMRRAGVLAPLWKKYGADPQTGQDLP